LGLHFTLEGAYALLQSGHSQAHIARKIGVDPSTISRELVRNTGARGGELSARSGRRNGFRIEQRNGPKAILVRPFRDHVT
jgi:IS30 family transposase